MKLCLTILLLFVAIASPNKGLERTGIDTSSICVTEVPKSGHPLYDSGEIVDYVSLEKVNRAKVVDKYYSMVKAMIDSACEDGITITINSGYRSFHEQLSIRRRYVRDRTKRDSIQFLLYAESKHFHPETARPGHSRHHSGIAYDFNTKGPGVYNWLKNNASRFGFVRTICEEKWHWEYLPDVSDQYKYVEKDHYSWKIKPTLR